MKRLRWTLFCFLIACTMFATMRDEEDANQHIYASVSSRLQDTHLLPFNELITQVALQFLGTEYVASTLEIEPEALRINLDKTDCILFVELCTAFALTLRGDSLAPLCSEHVLRATPSYELLRHNIQCMRYRQGGINGYASRIHYTSEWIQQNERYGILQEITQTLGGTEKALHFNFMTTHVNAYKQLQTDTMNVSKIREIENALSQQKYYFLPLETLHNSQIINKICNGDMVNFCYRGTGHDITHVGLAYWQDGRLHFIHASSKQKKVVIEKKTLAEYATNGVRIARYNNNL